MRDRRDIPPNKAALVHVRRGLGLPGAARRHVSPTIGVFSMATLEHGARTRAGVEVGDDLELVRKRYGSTECGEAVAGDSLLGGEQPTYPWCRALVGDVRVFFGADPIESITITSYGR